MMEGVVKTPTRVKTKQVIVKEERRVHKLEINHRPKYHNILFSGVDNPLQQMKPVEGVKGTFEDFTVGSGQADQSSQSKKINRQEYIRLKTATTRYSTAGAEVFGRIQLHTASDTKQKERTQSGSHSSTEKVRADQLKLKMYILQESTKDGEEGSSDHLVSSIMTRNKKEEFNEIDKFNLWYKRGEGTEMLRRRLLSEGGWVTFPRRGWGREGRKVRVKDGGTKAERERRCEGMRG
jgi:hypothetical protein